MPDPNLYTSRREFISGGLTLLSTAGTLPLFLGHTLQALAADDPTPKKKDDSQRILVVIQLAGGNDGLNMIVPCEMDAYYRARKQIAIAKKDALPLKDGFALHPSATGLKELFDAGQLAVVHGVGYPNPNRSHFTSTDIWATADPQQRTNSGWLGRYFDACCSGTDPDPEPIKGIALNDETPLAMSGDRFMPLAFENPDSLSWRAGGKDAKANEIFRKLNNIDGELPEGAKGHAAFLQRAALKAQISADQIKAATGSNIGARRQGLFDRGGGLGRNLQMVARMIAADLPTKVYYVSMGGFDTHTGQQGRHQRLMTELGNSIKTFYDELAEHKLADRVLLMTFSEFGRRVEENASGGTDHGEAAPLILAGPKVIGGMHEKFPAMDELHRGDLAFTTDFRRVYATVLDQWLKLPSKKVLTQGFQPLRVIKSV